MKFEARLPCDQLLPYVKHLIISDNENSATYKVLPDTALVIGFQYRGKLSYSDGQETLLTTAGITGLRIVTAYLIIQLALLYYMLSFSF